jgi:hypothetical protein
VVRPEASERLELLPLDLVVRDEGYHPRQGWFGRALTSVRQSWIGRGPELGPRREPGLSCESQAVPEGPEALRVVRFTPFGPFGTPAEGRPARFASLKRRAGGSCRPAKSPCPPRRRSARARLPGRRRGRPSPARAGGRRPGAGGLDAVAGRGDRVASGAADVVRGPDRP